MNPWPEVELGDHVDLLAGFAFKSAQFSDDPTNCVRLLRGDNVAQGLLRWSGAKHWTEDEYPDFEKYHLAEGDVILAMDRPWIEAGLKYAYVRQSDLPCLLVQRVARLRGLATLETAFLRYVIGSPAFTGHVQGITTGVNVPHISGRDIKRFRFPLPPIETQQRIAAILGAYDDLIEVNRRRVAVLEEMARGLFEEWFVRFRFPSHEDVPIVDMPGGPLPEGWKWKNLYDAAEVSFGFAFKSKAFSTEPIGSRVVRIRDVQEGRTSTWTTEEFDPKYQVRNGDILIGMDGIFHTNFWVGGDAALNQRVTRLRPKSSLSSGWLFQAVLPKIKFFEATISGTTVAHLGAKHLKTINLPLAAPPIQEQADRFFSPIDASLIDLKVANERLAASRDLLLPRLISGQLSVETAERELENAA